MWAFCNDSTLSVRVVAVMSFKSKRQYLLTLQARRYCLFLCRAVFTKTAFGHVSCIQEAPVHHKLVCYVVNTPTKSISALISKNTFYKKARFEKNELLSLS